jgi:hypothetical protein
MPPTGLPVSPAFVWMETVMDYILYWLILFLPIIILKIALLKIRGVEKSKDSMLFTEAIGLPLTFLQPVAFAIAAYKLDWLGMFVTFWWGPGFLFVVFLVIRSKVVGRKINWGNSGKLISWLCKINYIVYLALAVAWNMPKLIFALSAWIASDQIEKTFASLDADRTRRTFHDSWIIRVLYPVLLFTPFFYDLEWYFKAHGTVLFILWASGLIFVYRKGQFFEMPEDPTLLRNMTYFKKE